MIKEKFRPIIAGMAGTTAFTLYSYGLSHILKNNFREPQLLNQLFPKMDKIDNVSMQDMKGWIIHYLTGSVFAITYNKIVEKTGINHSNPNAVLLGIPTGVLAVTGWYLILTHKRFAPRGPSVDFLSVIFTGHIIFTLGCFRIFRLFSTHRKVYSIL